MTKIEFGKIKCPKKSSNIYGIAAQLIIHMKQLVEFQYKSYYTNPDSDLIPAIIDIYEQMQNKLEYLDIDPFIHAINRELKMQKNYSSNFKDFFSCIINKIDFTNIKDSYNDQIIFTCLVSLLNDEAKKSCEYESRFFDISLENNKSLSELIVNQYKFSNLIFYGPLFLFFTPIKPNEILNNLTIDEKFTFKSGLSEYKLSIIVVKKIDRQYYNHFVLYICLEDWIEIDDEEITIFRSQEIFKKIKDHVHYRIELLGYCRDPTNSIVSMNSSKSKLFEYYDIDKIQVDPSQITDNNDLENSDDPLPDHEKNNLFKNRLSYAVTFIDFDVQTFSSKSILPNIFNSAEQRDKYIDKLENESRKKSNILLYDSDSNGFGSYQGPFDVDDFNIIVYSVSKSNDINIIESNKPIFFAFRELDESMKEKETKEIYAIFNKSTTLAQLYEYCYKELPGNPTQLFTKNRGMSNYLAVSKSENVSVSLYDNLKRIYFKSTYDEQKLNSKIRIKSDDTLIVTRYYRFHYFNTEKNQTKITRMTISNKSGNETKVSELLKNHIILTGSKIPLTSIFTYYIKHTKTNFIIEIIEKNAKIMELPPFINIQVNPCKKTKNVCKPKYRFCVLFDINCKNYSVFDPNRDGFPFSIQYIEGCQITDVTNSILDYLFSSNEVKYMKEEELYNPSIYRFQNGGFTEIDDCEYIEENELEPIFVSWYDSNVYNDIIKMIKDHIEASQKKIE